MSLANVYSWQWIMGYGFEWKGGRIDAMHGWMERRMVEIGWIDAWAHGRTLGAELGEVKNIAEQIFE